MPIINLGLRLRVERSEVTYVSGALWSSHLAGDVTLVFPSRLGIVIGHFNIQLLDAGCSRVPLAPITNNNVS